jgi:hypothetical protein
MCFGLVPIGFGAASVYSGSGGGGLYPIAHTFANGCGFVAWGCTYAAAAHDYDDAPADPSGAGGSDDPSGG